ncbi:MAG: hypothetical protein ACW96N_08525 [Candidatus Thorarchaeota archaeon]|jgi:hypothetical protein
MSDPIPFAIVSLETLPSGCGSTIFLQEDGSHHAMLTNTLTSLVRDGHKFTLEFPEPPQPKLPYREDIEAICRRCFDMSDSALIFPPGSNLRHGIRGGEVLGRPDFIVKVPRICFTAFDEPIEISEMRDALMGYPDMNEVVISVEPWSSDYLMIEVRFLT